MEIHRAIAANGEAGVAFALVTVLHSDGSTPAKAGAKAIVDAAGGIRGTMGGGAVEAEAQRCAVEALQTGRPLVFDFHLEGARVRERSPICGGWMRVLVDPTVHAHCAAYAAAADARERRERGVLVTTLRISDSTAEPSPVAAGPDESDPRNGLNASELSVQFLAEAALSSAAGFPGADALRATLKHEVAERFVSPLQGGGTQVEVLVEPVLPKPMLLIVGGGHVGQAVAWQADLVGFDLTVIDDRPEFTRRELFPEGTVTRCGEVPAALSAFPFRPDTFVVIVTRGHQHDAEALAVCLRQPVAYLGMIGSRRKVAMMRNEFVASGRATAAEFDGVHAPIGLDIGSVTVPEIAVSIVAQLVAERRRGVALRIPLKGTS